jgi:polyferredoxin
LIRITTKFAASSIAMGLVLLIATFLFGRFFCAVVCPLGVMQDALGIIRKKRVRSAKTVNYKALRYMIAAIMLFFLAGGWAIPLRVLDPFSRFGGMLAGFTRLFNGEPPASIMPFIAGTLLPFLCLAVLVMWKKRVYCVAVCPIGTILGLFSRYGIRQIRMNDSCTACGLCELVCPTGCIESRERKVDNERCVRCMNCVAYCANESLSLSGRPKKEIAFDGPANPSRRAFVLKGTALTLGIVSAGHILGGPVRSLARKSRSMEGLVLPPGAMNAEHFTLKCTSCQLCALNCPTKVIQPSLYGLGPLHLEFDHGACSQDCALCGAVCPSGALQRLPLEEKRWLKIGEAFCDTSKCRVIKENTPCYICSNICPKNAIFMMEAPNGLEVPEVAGYHCVGCGACQSVCPMMPRAITVTGVAEQSMPGGLQFKG